jgi:hypothetical protein
MELYSLMSAQFYYIRENTRQCKIIHHPEHKTGKKNTNNFTISNTELQNGKHEDKIKTKEFNIQIKNSKPALWCNKHIQPIYEIYIYK